ncbi:MAG: hypothetical protein J6U01_09970, partial [Clostridia bacterium]|nr:hypothetical protein [Clostridia bacterium]
DCKVEVGVKWKRIYFDGNRGITVDLEKPSYTVTGRASRTSSYDELCKGSVCLLTQDGPLSYYILLGNMLSTLGTGKDYCTSLNSDIELVSANGTLSLYE